MEAGGLSSPTYAVAQGYPASHSAGSILLAVTKSMFDAHWTSRCREDARAMRTKPSVHGAATSAGADTSREQEFSHSLKIIIDTLC